MSAEVSARKSPEILMTSTALLTPWGKQPRQNFEEGPLRELADDIREHGVLQPLIVRRLPVGLNGYSIIAGERRWRAARLAGVDLVPVIVRDDLADDDDAYEVALAENVKRKNLDPIEEAEGYRRLKEMGRKNGQIAESMSRSEAAISNAVRLLDLPTDVQELIREGKLSVAHGKALASYSAFPKLVSNLAKRAVSESWSSKTAEKALDQDPWKLTQHGLAREFGSAKFDQTQCQKCPYDARRNAGGWRLCLNPEHFDELQAAAFAARQAETEQRIEEQKAKGHEVPDLNDLRGTNYRRLEGAFTDGKIEGCKEDCEHKRTVKDFSGDLSVICVNVSCHEILRSATQKAREHKATQSKQQLQDRLADRVGGMEAVGSRELAILVANALMGHAPSLVKRAYTRATGHSEEFIPKALYGGSDERRHSHELLSVLSPVELVRFGLEVLLAGEVHNAYANPNYAPGHPLADWYLSVPQPAPTYCSCGQPSVYTILWKKGTREGVIVACADPLHQESARATAKTLGDQITIESSGPSTAGTDVQADFLGPRCDKPVLFAIVWKAIDGRSGTIFSCGEHSEQIQAEARQASETVSVEILDPSAAGKLTCSCVPAWLPGGEL